jgi:mycofactocin glycosyltransferase
VALVAPRITTPPGASALGRYEAARSSLDMGPDPARVAPGSRVSYVPTAAVVIRRSAVGARCFDERLAAGEDVDLVWRLVAAGWDVRYEPAVQVRHGEGPRWAPWMARRALYGTTAGPLGRRHPAAIAPARIPLTTLLAWALLAARRPGAAVAVTSGSTALLASRLAGVVDDPVALAARLTVSATARTAVPTVAGLGRVWSPALVGALFVRRLRLAAVAALGMSSAAGWRRRPADLDPVRYVGLRLCDDLAYGAGVWWGCGAARTARPLVPTVTGLPWRARRAAGARAWPVRGFSRRSRVDGEIRPASRRRPDRAR